MNKHEIAGEWQRAKEALGAAEELLCKNYEMDAVSRAYYARMHAVRAALFVHDVQTKSHTGTKQMFGLRLIKEGRIESKWANDFAESMDEQSDADYDVHTHFSPEDARRSVEQAREFLDRIREYLLENGMTEEDIETDAIK